MTAGGPGPIRRFIGYALAAVGALIAVSAGLCTGWVLLSMVSNVLTGVHQAGDETMRAAAVQMLSGVWVPIIVGGIPIAVGVVIFIAGWRLAKGPKR